jgi:hypothetical protein
MGRPVYLGGFPRHLYPRPAPKVRSGMERPVCLGGLSRLDLRYRAILDGTRSKLDADPASDMDDVTVEMVAMPTL